MKTAKSAVLHFTLRDDGIIRADSQPGIEPTPALLEEAEARCRLVRSDVRRPALWNITDLTRPQPQVGLGFIETAPKNLAAIAILGTSDQIARLGVFPALMNDLLLPVAMFDGEPEAIAWLSRYLWRVRPTLVGDPHVHALWVDW